MAIEVPKIDPTTKAILEPKTNAAISKKVADDITAGNTPVRSAVNTVSAEAASGIAVQSRNYASLQAAFNATPSGGTLVIEPRTHTINGTVTVSKPVTIDGHGAIFKQIGADAPGFIITTDDVTINGITMTGPGGTVWASKSRAIQLIGDSPTERRKNLRLNGCHFKDWGTGALWAQNVADVKITNCDVTNTAHVGFLFMTADNCEVTGGTIRNVRHPVGRDVAYGVAFTQWDGTHPRSTNCKAIGVTVDGCNWEALDTHGGQNIVFSGNIIRNSRRGIACVWVGDLAPLDIVVTGNNIAANPAESGTVQSAIYLVGSGAPGAVVEYATGSITGNVIRGHGGGDGNTLGGISFYFSRGATVQGNTIIEASGGAGIVPYQDNIGFNVTGNTIIDAWSDTFSGVCGIYVRGERNEGYIGDNKLVRGTKAATYVNRYGLRALTPDTPGNKIRVGINDFNSATSAAAYYNLPLDTTYGQVSTTVPPKA